MTLSAASALPMQKEKTDKKRRRMPLSQYFKGKPEDDEKGQPSLAEKTASDWIKPGGGYDQYKKGDAEREKRLPIGGMEKPEEKNFQPKQPLKPMKRKMTLGQRIAARD